MKIKSVVCLAIVLWSLAACDNQAVTPTAVSEAVTQSVPTATDTAVPTTIPTNTAVPTDTTTPTETPTTEPTATPTNTPSPVPTNTPSPEPTATATRQPTATIVQPTTTPTTAVPISAPVAPPSALAPAGPNLLANPGFEAGSAGWTNVQAIQGGSGNARFIRSGQHSALGYAGQIVSNIVPGTTYRAGAWVIMWSSTGENRSVSENPGDLHGRICINTNGNNDPLADVCSEWVQSLDTWQYISIDAVATQSVVNVRIGSVVLGANRPLHNEAYWDDVELGLAPVAATATPLPTPPPSRPAPIPFNPSALRDNMNFVRSQIEQMGGVLDRMYNGEPGKCSEYLGYYNAILTSPTYDGIPVEWQMIYNDYIFAVENTLATNDALKSLCTAGGGLVTQHNYGVGRQGINISLERLIPAIEAANALSGG